MIVVDTDVISSMFIRDDLVRSGIADRIRLSDPSWLAPALWRSEYRNVLAKYMRFRSMDLEDARRLFLLAERLMVRQDTPVYTPDVLALVAKSGCTAYDCEFVAAAKSLGTRLVTGDRALAAAFPETAVTMEDFVGEAG